MKSVKVAVVVARNRHAATPRRYPSDLSMTIGDLLDGSASPDGDSASDDVGSDLAIPAAAAITIPATSSSTVADNRIESANASAAPATAPVVAPAPNRPNTTLASVMVYASLTTLQNSTTTTEAKTPGHT